MKATVKLFERKDGHMVYEARFTAEKSAPTGYGVYDEEAYDCEHAASEIDLPEVGKMYMVGSNEYVGPNNITHLSVFFGNDNGEGWPGNSDSGIRRYHGWRGTTDDYAVHGHGVRLCTEASVTGKRSQRVRIVFGPDTKPDED